MTNAALSEFGCHIGRIPVAVDEQRHDIEHDQPCMKSATSSTTICGSARPAAGSPRVGRQATRISPFFACCRLFFREQPTARPVVESYPREPGGAIRAEEAGVEPTRDAFAPLDGFEDRAPHRGRCSSEAGIPQFAPGGNTQGSLRAEFAGGAAVICRTTAIPCKRVKCCARRNKTAKIPLRR